MSQPLVATVILNTNRRDDTLECLASLAAQTYARNMVMVLDNASTDGSVEAIRLAHPHVQIVPLSANLGYAGNNNVGMRVALEQGAEWVFVLNEDTVLAPDCIERLVAEATADETIGVVGPMVYHHDEPSVIQSAGGLLDTWWLARHAGENEDERGQFRHPRDVQWISGCAILVRRTVVEQVGPLDERFFYYWEETEWCVRATRAGWRIRHVPTAHLWHKGVKRNYAPGPNLNYYNTRNRLLLLAKHDAPLRIRARAWFDILRTITSWTLKPKWRDRRDHRDAMVQGVLDFARGRWGQRRA